MDATLSSLNPCIPETNEDQPFGWSSFIMCLTHAILYDGVANRRTEASDRNNKRNNRLIISIISFNQCGRRARSKHHLTNDGKRLICPRSLTEEGL